MKQNPFQIYEGLDKQGRGRILINLIQSILLYRDNIIGTLETTR